MMISTGNDNYQKFSNGNQDCQMFSTGKDNKYIEFKYAPSDFEIGVYHNKETKTDTYYHLLDLNKIVSFIKKEFTPYDKNQTLIEVELKVYNKESEPWLRQKLNTTNNYYINSVDEPRLEEMIQGLKDYGFTMSEGSVEEFYYNYLGTNRSLGYAKNLFGECIWELYEKK